jgi:hypothetical protein
MKKLILIPLLVTLIVILAACSAGGVSSDKQKWEDANITNYRFKLTLSCFCPFQDQMPLSIEVRNGTVVSMTYPDGRAVASDDINYEFFLQYGTMDNLFAKIEGAQADPEAGEVIVKYDPTYGFPVEASIDYIKLAIDDEMYVTVSEFEKLP